MKRRLMNGLLVGLSGVLLGAGLITPAPAQNSPLLVSQRGAWQPVARVNPAKPVRVQIVNKTRFPLEYILSTQTNFRQLAPGKTAYLSGFPLPADLNINPARDRVLIRYQVTTSVKNNLAVVQVYPSAYGGQRSLNINRTGAIYVY